MVWASYKSEPNHALIRAIVQSRSWVEKLKAGKSVSDITASEGISEGRFVEAYSPGLSLTQARYCHIGWHHQSGANNKQAIRQGYPPQLGGAEGTVSLLNSLLIGIKFLLFLASTPKTPMEHGDLSNLQFKNKNIPC